MGRPTILQILPQVETGGSEQTAVEINQALVRAGAKSIVVSAGGSLTANIARDGGINIRLPVASKNPLAIFSNAKRVQQVIADHHVDLVHARSRAPAWSAWLACRRTKLPLVTTYHGAYSEKTRVKSVYNSVMARGEKVIVSSRFVANLVHERYDTPFERMPVIPRGVDLAAFNNAAVTRERMQKLRQDWDIGPHDRIVLHPARVTRWKGQMNVIGAARHLLESGRLERLVFILAGSTQHHDDYYASLVDLIHGYNLDGRVRLVGHCYDLPSAMAMASVTLIASEQAETFGRTSIEAQAMGCPVIVTDIGAAPEIIVPPERPDYTGWVVPVGDSLALADAIAHAVQLDPRERQAIAGRARAHVLKHYSLPAMQARTLGVYDGLIGSSLQKTFITSLRRP